MFSRHEPEPAELREVSRPRIGYFGHLSKKIDFELLDFIAKRESGWNIIIVGGQKHEDDAIRSSIETLDNLPNIFFLGEKPYSDIPAFVNSMDVNLMCYRVGEQLWSDSGSPLKLYEYLASGKPVVGSAIQAIIENENVVAVARSREEWLQAIRRGLDESDARHAEQRRAVAKQNTWASRVQSIDDLFSKVLGT